MNEPLNELDSLCAMTLLFALLAFCSGCSHSKHAAQTGPTRVSQYATTPLPVPPPLPDPMPTSNDIGGATGDVQNAQRNVEQVMQMAQTTPAAQQAIPPLTSADAHLTAALQKLANATQHITELSQQLNASEAAHQQAESIMRGDIDKLKTAAGADAAKASQQLTALETENAQLKNEAMQRVRTRLEWIGALLCLGGIAAFALSFYIGFTAGHYLGPIMGSCGVMVLGFARMLPTIEMYGEYGCIGAGVLLVAWLIVEGLMHARKSAAATVVK